ncbi:MAG: hypothetical protein AABW88_03995 [Nanoarchaeota archaeon]
MAIDDLILLPRGEEWLLPIAGMTAGICLVYLGKVYDDYQSALINLKYPRESKALMEGKIPGVKWRPDPYETSLGPWLAKIMFKSKSINPQQNVPNVIR